VTVRRLAIAALLERIADPRTSAAVKKAAAGFQKAAAKEKADAAHTKPAEKHEAAKVATVVAVRELAGDLQKEFAEEPARMKRLLGQRTGGGKKKTPKPPQKPDKPDEA